jgi:hypothetical protein
MTIEVAADPFGEHVPARHRRRYVVLGADCEFQSDSLPLLRVVDAAFGGLPARRAAGSHTHRLRLHLQDEPQPRTHGAPPMRLLSGAGLLGAATGRSSFTVLSPATRAGIVAVPRDLLAQPYILRYELIELAALTLLARTQELVPLHAACVTARNRALLLLGASGAGKSTFCMHWMRRGHQLLSEDGVFIAPRTLEARGVAPFLHLRRDNLRFVTRREAAAIGRSPLIRRRSGVEKFELDLRRRKRALAADGVPLAGVVRLTRRRATRGALVADASAAELRAQLGLAQAYATQQPGWRDFLARLSRLPCVELRRGSHPDESVHAVEQWLSDLA